MTFEEFSSADVDAAIAPALELAVAVAKASAQLRPAPAVPRALRRLAQFAKLPASARPTVRRAIEEDAEFRERVAAVAEMEGLPAASVLFLRRPEGWETELAGLLRDAAGVDAASQAERAERTLQRRLAGAEAAVVRIEAALAASRAELSKVSEELAGERRSRREAELAVEALTARLEAAEVARDQARAAAEAEAAVAEALRGDVRAAVEAARRAQAADAAEAVAGLERERAARVRAEELAADAEGRQRGVGEALAGAAAAAAALGAALARAADALAGGSAAGAGDDQPATALAAGPVSRPARPRPVHRRPSPLPPAVFDDSPEAAEHLVRVPGMLVLIDGYNVSISAWQELPVAAQRARLIDACTELAARTGAEILIVFDGAAVDAGAPADVGTAGGRGRVRWRFSPPDVEADDVLLEIVSSTDVERPVTVASSDRRVRDGARARGANAISTPQLLRALRREPPGRR